ncbi:hypothetical protein G3I15_54310, partial [Streptomyces sp. SID10244]|nr:hypothetical protein [Streptomyces sp. SID10244]
MGDADDEVGVSWLSPVPQAAMTDTAAVAASNQAVRRAVGVTTKSVRCCDKGFEGEVGVLLLDVLQS